MPDVIETSAADAGTFFEPGTFWKQFHHDTVGIKGVRLHFVEGGSGPAILLLPGWPQSWYAWRHVMPLLVKAGRRVIALDPRGMGDSDRPASGYEMRTVAAELHDFVEALGLTAHGPVDIVGHDMGVWMAYAFAAEWPDDVRRLAVFEAALPGVTPPPPAGIPSAEANVKTWHLAFNRLDDLPEILLQGRERELLTWLFRNKSNRPWAITPADIDEYVRVNAAPGAMRAALAYQRHNLGAEGLADTRARAERQLAMPVLAVGADGGVGTQLFDTMRLVAADVRGVVLSGCGHYLPEEAPRAVGEQIIRFTSP
jgi:pimeloyl-ACP methyl ester carboxylesterase